MRRVFICTAIFCTLAAAAQAEVRAYQFTWSGANGHRVTGALAYDADLTHGDLVREADLVCFSIEGMQGGRLLGRWALGMLTPQTSWRLFFVPSQSVFLVEGQGVDMPQAWNMNGDGDDCGAGGFGFNIGSYAQDICVDGELIIDSQVSPYAPFAAKRNDGFVFPPDGCLGPMMLSRWAN
ncbi:MAG: hypothetical protein AAF891_01825 [Pseudomonadota bacterium]